MKPKHKPKFVALTNYDIALGEFNNKRELNNWLSSYGDSFRPVKKILSGKQIKQSIYLPLF